MCAGKKPALLLTGATAALAGVPTAAAVWPILLVLLLVVVLVLGLLLGLLLFSR
jgi:hypothetical protein